MKKERILYAITVADVIDVAREIHIRFSERDLDFIREKIGDYFGSQWYDAVEYSLTELKLQK